LLKIKSLNYFIPYFPPGEGLGEVERLLRGTLHYGLKILGFEEELLSVWSVQRKAEYEFLNYLIGE